MLQVVGKGLEQKQLVTSSNFYNFDMPMSSSTAANGLQEPFTCSIAIEYAVESCTYFNEPFDSHLSMDRLRLNRLLGSGLGCVSRVELGKEDKRPLAKAVHRLCPRKAVEGGQ